MRSNFVIGILLTGLVTAAGCTDPAQPLRVTNVAPERPAVAAAPSAEHDDGHDAPRISLADAKKEYDAGTAVIVDVRDINAYNNEHIKGALHIPLADLDAKADKLPKGKKVIAYCS